MALTLAVGNKELERQATLSFRQRDYKVFLALNPGGLTADSEASLWLEAELSFVTSPGYISWVGTLGLPYPDPATGQLVFPPITAIFQAEGDWTWDTVCVWLTGEPYLHSANVEAPARTLSSGAIAAYNLSIAQTVA